MPTPRLRLQKSVASALSALAVIAVVGAWGQGYVGRVDLRKSAVGLCVDEARNNLVTARKDARDSIREDDLAGVTNGKLHTDHDASSAEAADAARDLMSRTGVRYGGLMVDVLQVHAGDPGVHEQMQRYCNEHIKAVKILGDAREPSQFAVLEPVRPTR